MAFSGGAHVVDPFHGPQARRAGPKPRKLAAAGQCIQRVQHQRAIVRHHNVPARHDVEIVRDEVDVGDEDKLGVCFAGGDMGRCIGGIGSGKFCHDGVGRLVQCRGTGRESRCQMPGKSRGQHQRAGLRLIGFQRVSGEKVMEVGSSETTSAPGAPKFTTRVRSAVIRSS